MRRSIKHSIISGIKRKRGLLVLNALLLAGVLPLLSARVAFAHNIPNPTLPASTTSYYAATMNSQTFYNKGCAQGRNSAYYGGPSDGMVILAFGQPAYENNQYGQYIYDANYSFHSTAEIETVVESYARGFWNCTPWYGPLIRIAIGTSNQGSITNYAHGAAWATMVRDVSDFVNSQPNWATQISIAGAGDIEVNWSNIARMRDWIAGYNSVSGRRPYYDFGDAAGCYPYNGGSGWNCANGWTSEDVWFKTYGAAPAQSVPEIYFTTNNNVPRIGGQWQKLSLYAWINHGHTTIGFMGTMAQYDACGGYGQRSNDRSCWNNGNPATGIFTNRPIDAIGQLLYKLNNNDPAYHGDQNPPSPCTSPPDCHRTNRSYIRWSTDISKGLR